MPSTPGVFDAAEVIADQFMKSRSMVAVMAGPFLSIGHRVLVRRGSHLLAFLASERRWTGSPSQGLKSPSLRPHVPQALPQRFFPPI
jgi:hypothetical protein